MSFSDDEEDKPGGSGYRDITNAFLEAADDIPPGTMIGMKLYTLHDAMMAIEVMDIRMDSGVARPGFPRKAFDPLRLLLPEEICWIMDRMCAAEMFWHTGQSLSQSVFTCLYVHEIGPGRLWEGSRTAPELFLLPQDRFRPVELVTIVLKAAVFGLLKSCDLACREYYKGQVNEMEDFNGEKSDRYICELISELEVVAMLDAAKRWLLSGEASSLPWRAELINRIELRRAIILCLAYRLPDDMAIFDHTMRSAELLLEDIRNRAMPNPVEGSPAYNVIDPSIHSRLLNVMPLKFIHLPTQEESWDAYAGFIAGMREVCMMCQCPSILDIKDLLKMRAFQPPGPNRTGLVRSFAKSFLWYTRTEPWADQLFTVIADVVPSIALDNNNLPNVHIHLRPPSYFSGIIEKMTVEYFSSFFCNRPRQRRRLCNWMGEYALLSSQIKEFISTTQTSLEKLAEMQGLEQPRNMAYRNASNTYANRWTSWFSSSPSPSPSPSQDQLHYHQFHQHPPHFGNFQADPRRRGTTLEDLRRIYLAVGILRLMAACHIVLSGLELDLYSPQELPFVYWYGASIFRALEETLGALKDECEGTAYQQYKHQHQNSQSTVAYLNSEITWSRIMVQAFEAACITQVLASRRSRKEDPVREDINLRRRFKWAFEGLQGSYDPMAVTNLDEQRMYRGDPCTPLVREWHKFRMQLEMKLEDDHLRECIALHGRLEEALLAHIQESSLSVQYTQATQSQEEVQLSHTKDTVITARSTPDIIERAVSVHQRVQLLQMNVVIDLREVAASTTQTLTLVLNAINGLDANVTDNSATAVAGNTRNENTAKGSDVSNTIDATNLTDATNMTNLTDIDIDGTNQTNRVNLATLDVESGANVITTTSGLDDSLADAHDESVSVLIAVSASTTAPILNSVSASAPAPTTLSEATLTPGLTVQHVLMDVHSGLNLTSGTTEMSTNRGGGAPLIQMAGKHGHWFHLWRTNDHQAI